MLQLVEGCTLRSVGVNLAHYGSIACLAWLLGNWTRDQDIGALGIWLIVVLVAPVVFGILSRHRGLSSSAAFFFLYSAALAYASWQQYPPRKEEGMRFGGVCVLGGMSVFGLMWTYMSIAVIKDIRMRRDRTTAAKDVTNSD